MKYTIYLAGPMAGCSDSEANDWRDYVTEKLQNDFNILSPMRRDYRR